MKYTRKADPIGQDIVQSRYLTLARFDYTAYEKTILTHIFRMLQPALEGEELKGDIYERVTKKMEQLKDVQCTVWEQGHVTIKCHLSQLGGTGDNWKEIKEALSRLNGDLRCFEIEDEFRWQRVHLIEMPSVEKGKGDVEFTLHKELLQAFFKFGTKAKEVGHSRFDLGVSLNLVSIYSRRFYEMVANGKPFRFTVQHLREIFKVGEDKYSRDRDFIKRCVETAKKELDAKSPWSFDYTLIKQGKKFNEIAFTPIHIIKNDPEAQRMKEIERQDRNLLFLPAEAKNHLLHNGWKKTELQNNKQLFIDASKVIGGEFVTWCQEKWDKAQDLERSGRAEKGAKAWFIGTLKAVVKEDDEHQMKLF